MKTTTNRSTPARPATAKAPRAADKGGRKAADAGRRPAIAISFVCLGNICRSPTAEGIMRKLVEDAGLGDHIAVESAGTGAWHIGEPADPRARETARARGIDLCGTARQFEVDDFERLDYVIALDRRVRDALRSIAPSDDARDRIRMLREFDPDEPVAADVPDPYYGGPDGFDHVFDLCEAACRGLLDAIRRDYGLA